MADKQNSFAKISGDLVVRMCCSSTVVITNSRVFLIPRRATACRTVAAFVRRPVAAEFTCRSKSTVMAESRSSTSHKSPAVHSGRFAFWHTAETVCGNFGTSSLGGMGGLSVLPISCTRRCFQSIRFPAMVMLLALSFDAGPNSPCVVCPLSARAWQFSGEQGRQIVRI